ncbi:phosphoesterase family-domain-containing protein [Gongronella butleri]|nr:phosphoesterase family-domain-containing protein [Gongronella butleri]
MLIHCCHGKPSNASSTQHHGGGGGGIVRGKYFDRVVIFIFENKFYKSVIKDKNFSKLHKKHQGKLLTNFKATTHPSQPNYIALISGTPEGANGDNDSNIKRKNIVDLLEKKKISWKTYQENYPGNCNKASDIGSYARKHNPFMGFVNISRNKKRCSNIVNAKQLDKDIAANKVPQYVFYTPNLNHDAHDKSIKYAGRWFSKFLAKRINKPAFNKNTLFIVTFDEDDGGNDSSNHVYTALLGPGLNKKFAKATDAKKYNHYSILRTIEDNWGLGDLGQHDKDATLLAL